VTARELRAIYQTIESDEQQRYLPLILWKQTQERREWLARKKEREDDTKL